MTIKAQVKDSDGHKYWWYEDRSFVLGLKEKPDGAIQFRTVAFLRKGVYLPTRLVWHRKKECWSLARMPLLKTTTFQIQIVHVLEAIDADGVKYEGWVHPRVLSKRPWYKATQYEKQVALFPKDLKKTREEAEAVWKKLSKE